MGRLADAGVLIDLSNVEIERLRERIGELEAGQQAAAAAQTEELRRRIDELEGRNTELLSEKIRSEEELRKNFTELETCLGLELAEANFQTKKAQGEVVLLQDTLEKERAARATERELWEKKLAEERELTAADAIAKYKKSNRHSNAVLRFGGSFFQNGFHRCAARAFAADPGLEINTDPYAKDPADVNAKVCPGEVFTDASSSEEEGGDSSDSAMSGVPAPQPNPYAGPDGFPLTPGEDLVLTPDEPIDPADPMLPSPTTPKKD